METFKGNQQAITRFLLQMSITSHPVKSFHVLKLKPNLVGERNVKTRCYVCTVIGCKARFEVNPCSNASFNHQSDTTFIMQILNQHNYNLSITCADNKLETSKATSALFARRTIFHYLSFSYMSSVSIQYLLSTQKSFITCRLA